MQFSNTTSSDDDSQISRSNSDAGNNGSSSSTNEIASILPAVVDDDDNNNNPNKRCRTDKSSSVWSNGSNNLLVVNESISNPNHQLRSMVNLWFSDRENALERYGDISTWDTSKVTDMRELFKDRIDFNYEDIMEWDLTNVTDTTDMFKGVKSFQDLMKSTPMNDRVSTSNMNMLKLSLSYKDEVSIMYLLCLLLIRFLV